MATKLTRRMCSLLLMALILVLTIPAAAADQDDKAAFAAYWRIIDNPADESPLARAMRGEAVDLDVLTAVTADDLLAFAAGRLPIDMARYGWYAAMVQALRQQPQTDATLRLFLSMPETWRDSAANADRRAIRLGMTQAEVERISRENGLPGGFVAWLLLEDEWHEGDWEDVDDWREGRSSWIFADHAYEKELRETRGKSAVVDDDDVERVLRQNGIRYDD